MGTRGLVVAAVVVAALVLAACSDSTPPPTLASGTTATTSPPPTSQSTSSPATSTTTAAVSISTTAAPSTTTLSPDARLAEIERMVHEALVGRLQAMYDKDPDALLPWVASQKVYDRTIEAFDLFVFVKRPTLENVGIAIDDLLLDRADCVVTLTNVDATGVSEGASEAGQVVAVWWPNDEGILQAGAFWSETTPQQIWMEECDVAPRGLSG